MCALMCTCTCMLCSICICVTYEVLVYIESINMLATNIVLIYNLY